MNLEELQSTLDRLKAWGISPDKLTSQVVADIFTGLKAARLVADPDHTLGWCFRHNAPMDNLAYCEKRNAMSADLEDRCTQEQAIVLRSPHQETPMKTELDFCNDGQAHQWRRPSTVNREDGMICGGCGVSEAELDYLIGQQQRRTTPSGDTE